MILDEIVRRKRKDLRRMLEETPLADLRTRARSAPPVRDFTGALTAAPGVAVIAEFKRRSPSRGPLAPPGRTPADTVRAYREGGAAACSVLTDEPFFDGRKEDLIEARTAVDLPVLRKDFVIDEAQLHETRALPADAALLIVRILEPSQLADYIALAREDLGLSVLVEIHSERELETALDAGAPLIGINNRDLDTFEVSLDTTVRLRPQIPDGIPVVAESGIRKREDMVLLGHLGVEAALIGESLVGSGDPGRNIRILQGEE